MLMALKYLFQLPVLFPIPHFNGKIIGTGQNIRLGRMNGNISNVIWVGFKLSNFFTSQVIVNSDIVIVRSNNDPILTGNKLTGSYRQVGDLNRLNQSVGCVRPDFNFTIV